MAALQATSTGVLVRGLRKQFGETQALDGLDIAAAAGRITGIAGPNGAGKSTLVRILAGEVRGDGGEVFVHGERWTPTLGATQFAVVHQEPQLFPNLTVLDNLLVGREGVRARRPAGGARERELLARFRIERFARQTLGSLSIGVQQRVEIVRAVAQDTEVVLFDEPNSALTREDSDELFAVMHQLASEGHSIILVSHRLADLTAHAAEVAVILDGRCSVILSGRDLTEENLARAITVTGGRSRSVAGPEPAGPVALAVRDWRHKKGVFGPVNAEVRAGEIVAITGLEGSGGREFVRSIAGFEPATGHLELAGAKAGGTARGVTGYVPPDRRAALFFNFSVGENIISRLADAIRAPLGLRSRRRSMAVAGHWIERVGVKTSGSSAWIGSLSGGNQQKVLLAAAMAPNPPILLLEEPTRGVDVGTKRDIYSFLRDYVADGRAVVMYCTEIPEVFEAADRLQVMVRGRLSPPLRVAGFPDEKALASEVLRLEKSLLAVGADGV